MAKSTIKNEQVVRMPFVGGFEGRNAETSKDQRFVNMYIEKTGVDSSGSPKLKLIKRPGVVQDSFVVEGTCRGSFGWNNAVWSVIDDTLYKGNVSKLTLGTSSGNIGYTYCTTSGTPTLFLCDGASAWVISTTDVITQVTDVDFPTPHIPTPVYIDGYVCIPRANSADIYNCDLENPLGWTASNYITSELFPDNLVSLARQNNQLVAFGSTGTEFFYDAANATGTPFAKNSGAFLQIGSCAPFAIGQNERYCFFISQSQSGGRSVWKLDGFQPTQIGTDAIDRILDFEGVNILDANAYLIRIAGHFFFVIHLTQRTLVYDIDLDLWHEWSTNEVVPYTSTSMDGYAINDLVINGNISEGTAVVVSDTPFQFKFAADLGDGKVWLIHATKGIVAHFDTFTYTDLGQVIKCSVNTSIVDFGTYNRKFIHRLSLVSDLATNKVFLKWTDTDYQTWSKIHEIDMTTRPVLHRLGATRRRAFNLYYTDNYPFRVEGLEFTISLGET